MSGLFRKGALTVLVRTAMLAAVFGLVVAGCGSKPPVPVGPTPEQAAADLLTKAKELYQKGDLDEAEKLAKDSQAKQESDGVKALLGQIQEQKANVVNAKRQKEIDGLIAQAKAAMDAKDYDTAIAKASDVLKLDAAQPQAFELKAKAVAAKAASAGPDPKVEHARVTKLVDEALAGSKWDDAIARIRELEQYVPAGGASRQPEVAGIEGEKLVAEGAKLEAQARDINGLRDAKKRYDQALAKKDTQRVRERLANVQKKIGDFEAEQGAKQRAEQAIARADQLEKGGELAPALQLLRKAQQDARDPRLQREIRDRMVRINTELGYQTSVDAGDQAMVRNDFARAVVEYRKAQGIKDTPQIRTKLQEAEAVSAEAAGKQALEAGDLSGAIAKFEDAIRLRPTTEVAALLEDTKAKKERQGYLTEVERAKLLREQKQFKTVAVSLKALAAKYPDWPEAGALYKQGPLKDEQTAIDAAALKGWNSLQGQLKTIKVGASKIAAIEAALPGLAGSKYEGMAERSLTTEKDALARAKYTALTAKVKTLKTGGEKVAMLTAALPEYKGTTFAAQIEKSIQTEKDALASAKHAALMADVNKLKTPSEKIAKLEGALVGFAGTSFTAQVEKAIMTEKDTLAKPTHTALMAEVAKLKTPAEKIAKLSAAVGAYEGTSLKAQIETAIQRETTTIKTGEFNALKASLAKAKTPAQKIAQIEAKAASFKGTSFEKQLDTMLSREKDSLKAADLAALKRQIASHKTSELKIAELQRRLPDFAGTKHEATVKKMIEKEKTAQVVGKYKALTTAIKAEKDAVRKIARLEAAVPQFKGTRYEASVANMLKTELTNKSKNMFTALQANVAKLKTAKEKAALLQQEKGKYAGTTYAKQIDGMIKTEQSKIAAEESAAKEAAAKKAYDDVMAATKKTPKDIDGNIAKLSAAKNQVEGTRYVQMIQNEIKKQEASKPKPKLAPK